MHLLCFLAGHAFEARYDSAPLMVVTATHGATAIASPKFDSPPPVRNYIGEVCTRCFTHRYPQ